ncbi:hypothetical protein QBC42DRAFT_228415 [Cladorrhinum samala]|uniref:Uncharacterized protein n=1 Tax=Cladorrhinum samala TaxID=585594 RepID=A0AAV9HPU8_9PEZI|nr:hypothetical protein QBC42DRAFT_228415 [Cladorrhinum samala]
MFCGISAPHHHDQRLLRSFRSHKSLSQQAAHPIANMHFRHHHQAKASDLSSASRSSMESLSSRPSTSGGKSELSVDWDPLRLHPPLANAPVPLILEEDNSRRYQPHEIRQSRSMHNLRSRQQAQKQHQKPSTSSTVIYGGFDFGFDTNPSQHHEKFAGRCPSPTPSSASDASSLYGVREAEEWGDNGVVTPLPAPRLNRRNRPRPPVAMSEAEKFITRGDWKRRGIVFCSDSTVLAGEDETWEI